MELYVEKISILKSGGNMLHKLQFYKNIYNVGVNIKRNSEIEFKKEYNGL